MAKKVLTPEQAEIKNIKKQANSSRLTSVLAIVVAVAITIGVVSFGKSISDGLSVGTGAEVQSGDTSDVNNNSGSSSDSTYVDEETGEIILDDENPVVDENTEADSGEAKEEETEPSRELPANPAEWTKAEVVNFYKAAAQKSTSAKSVQKMTMDNGMDVKINNSALEFAIGLAEPVIKAALKANSTEFDGITGGYNDLVPSDAESAKAYKDGDYTIVEMKMVEQIDDAYGDTYKGTVGHAISVVGNIAVVADNFPDWTINFEDAFVELHYKNPVVKVKINKDGVIEKGTWSYVVGVKVQGLQIEKVIVEDAKTDINYVITTGGGF
ncbi:MAG: hypothetical protein IJZ16_05330 [Clostridia bacterium]|nr:hypothetical protein [Clostridia bacterium]